MFAAFLKADIIMPVLTHSYVSQTLVKSLILVGTQKSISRTEFSLDFLWDILSSWLNDRGRKIISFWIWTSSESSLIC